MKNHLKRLNTPRTWAITRKSHTFVSKPSCGPHTRSMALPINVVLRDFTGHAQSTREVKYQLYNKEVLVDGVKRKDYRFPVGLFDVVSLPQTKEHIRIILTEKGKIATAACGKGEETIKPCKIIGKTMVGKKIQLNLYDGKNILVDKGDYKVGDTVVVKLGSQEITEHIKLDKKVFVQLTGGKHIGAQGTVEDIKGTKILCKIGDEQVETDKRHAFALGKTKSTITLQ